MSIVWLLVAGFQFLVALAVLLWNLDGSPEWDGRAAETSPTWATLQFAPAVAALLVALLGATFEDRRSAATLWLGAVVIWVGVWAAGFALAG